MQRIDTSQDYDILDFVRTNRKDVGIFLVRLSIGAMMLFHGIHKIMFGTASIDELLVRVGLPVFFSFGVFLGEVVAPILILLGFKTRFGGMLIALDMFMAILLVHSTQFFQTNGGGGWMLEINALYLLGGLAIAFLGSGRIAISKGKGSWD